MMVHRVNNNTVDLNSIDEELRTFMAVQVDRYLKRKTVHRFCSDAEKDVILQIIQDYWEEVKEQPQLSQMDTDCKVRAYYGVTVIFPYFVAEEEKLITVDFRKKRRISSGEACPCGSGRVSGQCCGNVPSLEILLNGSN